VTLAAAAARVGAPRIVRARRMCVFTLASLIPRSLAISFVDSPPATARSTSRWRSVSAAADRVRRATRRRART
jgi:hypothetical protein